MHQVINLNGFACTIKSDLQILQLFFYAFVVVVFFVCFKPAVAYKNGELDRLTFSGK